MFRALICLLTLAAVACAPGVDATPKAGAAMPSAIVDPYLKIQSALAEDSVEGVRANAGEIATASSALGAPAMKIDTAAVQLASAAELEDARGKFATLSEAIVTYVDGLHLTLPEGVRVVTCPMLHKPWLQEGDDVSNPYYGKSMLTCGDFR